MNYQSKYFKPISQNRIQCTLCNHYCKLRDNELGKCRVRMNKNSKMISLNWGKPTGFCLDPIEKKPLYHFYPGSKVLSFGCLGCNFTCLNCQNYHLSSDFNIEDLTNNKNLVYPKQIVEAATVNNAMGIAYTYSEPTIYWDYILDIIKEAKKTNPELKHILVSNGYFSDELLQEIIPNKYIDAMNIDLKFIDKEHQKRICGSKLAPILRNIETISKHSDIHLELTNLLIPELNNSDNDISTLSEMVFSISEKIPLHFSKFYPIFNMQEVERTDDKDLLKAKLIAERIGIENVYIGNTSMDGVADTDCRFCGSKLIIRDGYTVTILGKNIPQGIECNVCKNTLNIKMI